MVVAALLDLRCGFSIPDWVSARNSFTVDVVVMKIDSITRLIASGLAWNNNKM